MEQLLVMRKKMSTLGHSYAAHMLNKILDILGILQRLTYPPDPRVRHMITRHTMEFYGTNTQ